MLQVRIEPSGIGVPYCRPTVCAIITVCANQLARAVVRPAR